MQQTNLLIILDGWGHSDTLEHNAIAQAHTPTWDKLWAESPHTLIAPSGEAVGLPAGQMGNSEVGHMSLGAGRMVYQDLSRINHAIDNGSFATNPVWEATFTAVNQYDSQLHIMGLLSPGGVHSHEEQIFALIKAAGDAQVNKIVLHAFLDGRDTPPKSALFSLNKATSALAEHHGHLATVCGRYFAMDRDNRWDRVAKAYRLLTDSYGEYSAASPQQALQLAYDRGESDEFVQPTFIPRASGALATIENNDSIVFMNFRADRARELSRAFVEPNFSNFERNKRPNLNSFVSLTRYADDIASTIAYDKEELNNTLGELLANNNKTQLRVAETEKYAHVTFFFSGGREAPFPGETRNLIPSPDVATYDLKPEMSAKEVTEVLLEAINSNVYDLVVCNFANGDMVGHTGNFPAAIKAVECLDECLTRIVDAVKIEKAQLLITADHGNVESMMDIKNNQPNTAHTCEPVPLIYVGPQQIILKSGGSLCDIAPTIIELMKMEKPNEMTGISLVEADLS